jgi:protein-S-isoprenylcysteine O-methyltransferase Ste14
MTNQKKVLPPTYLLLALLAMPALHLFAPVKTVMPAPWNLLGILPLLAGVALNLLADSALKVAQTTVKPFQESNALVTSGVYAISRHPMYVGYVLILLGMAMMMRSLAPFFVVPVFAAFMDIAFIRVEEQMLENKFGQAYAQYKRQVRRWV